MAFFGTVLVAGSFWASEVLEITRVIEAGFLVVLLHIYLTILLPLLLQLNLELLFQLPML